MKIRELLAETARGPEIDFRAYYVGPSGGTAVVERVSINN